MPLPEMVEERLIKEFRFATNRMRYEQNPFRKLYFFSALHGEIGRALNWSWDRDLVLMHNTLQNVHQQLSARLRATVTGQERAMELPETLFERLTQTAQELASYLEGEKDKAQLCDLLGRFSEIAYATTGNGNFLIEKGVLKL